MAERGEIRCALVIAVAALMTVSAGMASSFACGSGINDMAAEQVPGPEAPALADSATATGPVGEGGSSVTITYVWSGSSPLSVTLRYTTNGGTTWNLAGTDFSVDGSFPFTCPVSGTYYWNANVGETDMVPAEAGPYVTPGVAPTVVSTSPVNGATGVSLTANIVITFSESMNTATLTFGTSFTISPNPGGSWTPVWSGGNSIVTFSHSVPFTMNTVYTCTVTTAVTDIAGIHMQSNYVWSFTTLSPAFTTATGPISATPTNVAAITLTYSYAGTPTSVNLYYTTNGGTTWTLAGNDVTVDGSYSYTITSGSGTYGWIAQSVGGGSTELSPPTGGTAPEASPYVFDITAPMIISTVPANGATGVSLTQTITVTFSEAIDPSSLTYSLVPNPGGLVPTFNIGNTILSISHNAFSFYTLYTMTINCKDISGNWLTIIGPVPNPWSWTTSWSPTIATGPTIPGWANMPAVMLTYVYYGTPTSVNLYYTMNGGTTWTLAGNDATVDGSYPYTITSGSGTYGWIAQSVGGGSIEPSPPPGGTAPEATPYRYDGTPPVVDAGTDMAATGTKNDATVDSTQSGTAAILWTSVPAGVVFTPNNALVTYVIGPTGVYNCTLTVTDNAGNVGTDSFTLTVYSPAPTWALYNGRNYRTFSSTLTPGWMASDLSLDIISEMNTQYGESLANGDVSVTMYDSSAGSFTTCYWETAFEEWVNDFALVEGGGYIIELRDLDTSPRIYELPNTIIASSIPVPIYNGRNYVGFPVAEALTASDLILDIVDYMGSQYGEALAGTDVSVTTYDSSAGSFTTCYWDADFGEWVNDFALSPISGYIVEVVNLDTTPRLYMP